MEVAVHRSRTPDQLLLGIILAHPGTSGEAPARRTGNADFKVERIRKSHGVTEGVLPAFAHIRKKSVNYLWC